MASFESIINSNRILKRYENLLASNPKIMKTKQSYKSDVKSETDDDTRASKNFIGTTRKSESKKTKSSSRKILDLSSHKKLRPKSANINKLNQSSRTHDNRIYDNNQIKGILKNGLSNTEYANQSYQDAFTMTPKSHYSTISPRTKNVSSNLLKEYSKK